MGSSCSPRGRASRPHEGEKHVAKGDSRSHLRLAEPEEDVERSEDETKCSGTVRQELLRVIDVGRLTKSLLEDVADLMARHPESPDDENG